MKKIICPLLLFLSAVNIASLPVGISVDPDIKILVEALSASGSSYSANEAFLESGRLQRESLMSMLYPRINFDIKTSGRNSFNSRMQNDLEVRNDYSFSAVPEVSVSQLLPSAGILSASISDSITGSGTEFSNSPIQPESDLKLSNTVTASIGLNQPLYFGNSYKASLDNIDASWEMTGINYLKTRNGLIISSIRDYYDLIKAAYHTELIRARMETGLNQFSRMEKELQLGAVAKSQVNSSRAALLQSEADLLKAERDLTSLKALFQAIYGLDFDALYSGNSAAPEIGPFTAPSSEETDLISMLAENNPDLQLSRKMIHAAESDIILEEKNSAAVFSAMGSYSLTTGITDTGISTDGLQLSIGMSAPITDGGASDAEIMRKRNEAARLRDEYQDSLKRLASQLNLLLDSIAMHEKLYEIYTLQENNGIDNLETGFKEFELGTITQKELTELQITLENTRLSMLINRIEKNISILSLYNMLGYDLMGLIGGESVKNQK